MPEIKCPNCNHVFKVDDNEYLDILNQVRTEEFKKEIAEREKALKDNLDAQIKLAKLSSSQALQKEIDELKAKLSQSDKDKEIALLKATKEKEEEILRLKNDLKLKDKENQNEIQNLELEFSSKLKQKEQEVEFYKDLKTRMSTKMVGETLEQHCENEFNKIRMTAFKNAYFEKDNDASSGSKGDYIFREVDDNGVEIISIMFEMKNEMDVTSTKHKNKDFFKELDKDRREKHCEYAVLVSLLESDSDLYNAGIVDVSYEYEKMYVVRPQCFIPIITLLRNAALNSLSYKRELVVMREQNIDITHFEENIKMVQDGFNKQYQFAHDRFSDAIKELDKAIDQLQKMRDDLVKSDDHYRIANDKIQEISIKKVTKNAPSVKAMFDELNKNK